MTEKELQQLCLDVAKKYGINPWYIYEEPHITWLYQDSGRCLDLAIEHGFTIYTRLLGVIIRGFGTEKELAVELVS